MDIEYFIMANFMAIKKIWRKDSYQKINIRNVIWIYLSNKCIDFEDFRAWRSLSFNVCCSFYFGDQGTFKLNECQHEIFELCVDEVFFSNTIGTIYYRHCSMNGPGRWGGTTLSPVLKFHQNIGLTMKYNLTKIFIPLSHSIWIYALK